MALYHVAYKSETIELVARVGLVAGRPSDLAVAVSGSLNEATWVDLSCSVTQNATDPHWCHVISLSWI